MCLTVAGGVAFVVARVLEAIAAYRELRAFSASPTVNEGMLQRAEKARIQACVTAVEGQLVKASSMPNGLGKKRTLQKIVREFGDSGVASSHVLPQIWALTSESGQPAASSAVPAAEGTAAAS
jgi:hypothetical protein